MSRNQDLESDDEGPPLDDDGFVVPEEQMAGPPNLHGDDGEPPRRQHKYTTADLQPERPWKRWLLICLAFLVTIVIMVLISIFLQKLFDPPEEEDWSGKTANNVTDDDQAGALSGESSLLPKNSEFINNLCAEEKLSGDTRQSCEQVCAPAVDCCDPYGSGDSTCFEEQVAGCVTYSQCHALEGTIDPAYNNLDRRCSMDSLALNREDCEQACTTMSCCYTDVDSCVALNFQACLDYAPCQNLKATVENSDASIAAAKASLDDQCKKGDPVCGRECKEATCCSDPNSDCYRDNFVSCLTYATCNQNEDSSATRITVEPIHSVVAAAPENLRDKCLQAYVESDAGPTECEAACAPAECCFADGAGGCFGTDPLGCMEYRGCSVLRQGR